MADDIGGVWRTVGGRRIFIKDGQDLASAMKESGKFNNKSQEQNDYKDVVRIGGIKNELYEMWCRDEQHNRWQLYLSKMQHGS